MKRVVVFLLVLLANTYADELCNELGGICRDWQTNFCVAGWVRDLCDNDPVRRCCLNCGVQCIASEASFGQKDDVECAGQCQDASNYCQSGYDLSAECGGGTDRQCCLRQQRLESECPIVEFTPTSTITSRNLAPILVHREFLPFLDEIAAFATETGVVVEITKSLIRRTLPTSRSRVLVPGRRNNHVIGRAIEFNLRIEDQNCGRNCIENESNDNANAFIERVDSHPVLNRRVEIPNRIHDGFDQHPDWIIEVRRVQNNCF